MSSENKTLTPIWIVYADGARFPCKYDGALRKIRVFDKLNAVGIARLTFGLPAPDFDNDDVFCERVVNNIIKTQVILTDSITISVYAQLVEDLFVLRFGKKPQDFTGSQIEYFIPAQQIVVSQAAINAGDVKENKVEAPSKS